MTSFGLIAGNGTFPLEVAQAAKARGFKVIAVAHRGETSPQLEQLCDAITWIDVGALETLIDVFKLAGIEIAAMAGGISRQRLITSFRPDSRALQMLAQVGKLSDDAVLRGVAAELESEGITVIDPVERFGLPVAKPGLIAGPEPPSYALEDIRLGFAVARALGTFDVGQVVAVRQGVVAAVEAIEGTDETMRRAAKLAGRGLVMVKVAKPSQDMRFDRPAIGPTTIELLHQIEASVLAVEAEKALILELARTLELAEQYQISVVGHV